MGGSEIDGILVMSLVLAALVAVTAWVNRPASLRWDSSLGKASFEFQESWISVFTLVFALAITLIGGGSFFSVLGLFFAMLVAFSPLVYRALAGEGTGSVGGYLLSAVMCLWAAFGFILTFALLVSGSGASLGATLSTGLMGFVTMLAILLIAVYSHGRIAATLKARSGGVIFL